ncbi:MAG: TylF/MycF family methyltransferase [Zoogloeaceae bacterium]|jgi:hypothetical protein|nr:TylF/MycF family methyltransferase [Zoogloeaceae bacterium]
MKTSVIRHLIRNTLHHFGYDIIRYSPDSPLGELASVRDLSTEQLDIIRFARPFTMTSVERMAALINAVAHISQNGIEGDIVECGVWRGGSMMIVARTLLACGDRSRSLYLFDTFEGMSLPTETDRSFDGISALSQLQQTPSGTGIWCHASLEDVRENLFSTGYPPEKIHFIKGKVEDTIPQAIPPRLALLRLDTDWYESTKHELEHLYPLLNSKGVLIIDDYGHWQGARKAVDEYFSGRECYLHRIDYTGRILVRTDDVKFSNA